MQARKGDALLFYSVMPDGNNMDEHSLHAGCPVLKGQKVSLCRVCVHVPRARHATGGNAAIACCCAFLPAHDGEACCNRMV